MAWYRGNIFLKNLWMQRSAQLFSDWLNIIKNFVEVKKLMIFKSRNLVNFILNFFQLYCCYRLKVSAYIVRVQSGRIERYRIRAIKFKAARIQFSSDVFVAVRRRCWLSSLLTFRKPVQSSEANGVLSLASRWYLTIVIDLIGQSSLEVRHVIAGRPWVKPWFYFLYRVLWRITVISSWYVFCRPPSLMDSPQLLDPYGILRGG